MGQCILTFNRIEIQNQKSDSEYHSDSDWLSLVWYAGNNVPVPMTVPLLKADGSSILHTGDVIGSFSQSFYCDDNDTVMAAYAITNLGSDDLDWSDEASAATQITDQLAQKASTVYLDAAREVGEAVLDDVTGQFWLGDAINAIVGSNWQKVLDQVQEWIDELFNDVFGPALRFLLGKIADALGHPNCNGEVLHGFVVFKPNEAGDGSFVKVYAGPQENSACGTAPHTLLDVTLSRSLDVYPFAPVTFDPDEMAAGEFRNRAEDASQAGYVGAFPNFYYGINGPANVGGTIFINSSCGEWRDIPLGDLGNPLLSSFSMRMRATDGYAVKNGFSGGFPNFFQAQRLVGILRSSAASVRGGWIDPAGNVSSETVCGTVLIDRNCAVRDELTLSALGSPSLTDIPALFRAVQDYATKNGFVGGFPTFNFELIGPGLEFRGGGTPALIVVLLKPGSAVWKDVVLYMNPS